MRAGGCLLLGAVLVCGLHARSTGQACHDWDADGAEAGWQCSTGTDCLDLSWPRRPGVAETCDGLDNDCGGTLDQGCDRYCDQPVLSPYRTELLVDGSPGAARACVGLTDAGIVSGSERGVNGTYIDRLIYARAYDRNGSPWAAASVVGDPGPAHPYESHCQIATAGERALISYRDELTRNAESYRLKARVMDRLGVPLGPVPVDLSATSPFIQYAPWNYHSPVWDGDRFVVFWVVSSNQVRNNLLMSVVNRDGSLGSPATIVVTDDVDGNRTTIQQISAVWTGAHFLIALTTDAGFSNPNLRVLKVSRDGVLLKRRGISTHADFMGVAKGSDRICVVFNQRTAVSLKAFAAFFDLDGEYLLPPGTLTLLSLGPGESHGSIRASWSGEMFGVAMATNYYQDGQYIYRWRFWRLLPEGTNLDPGGTLLADSGDLLDICDLNWAGNDFWLFAIHNPNGFFRERIVCSCADEDGDGFDACQELDCDDGDASAHLGATEICRGLRDEDCDGFVDCEDPSCPGGPGPADVGDLNWSGTGLVWTAVPGAERYDLARGLLGEVRRRGDLLLSECEGLDLTVPTWPDDGRRPPPGEALWYLVRTEAAPCALGGWGSATVPRRVTACR